MLFFAQTVSAQVFISEIKYTGNEWIEISNIGAPVDLSLWKFFEGGTNHKLKFVQGGITLASGEYAIIVNDATAFLSEHSGFSGMLLDSSFSLLDAGETISIKSSDIKTVDTVSYVGIKGSKNSIQNIDGVWREAGPTPGASNTVVLSTPAVNMDKRPLVNSNNETSPISKPQVVVGVVPQVRVALAGLPIIFEGRTSGKENNSGGAPSGVWSFGDGASFEGMTASHTYYYPGEYTVVFDVVIGNDTATDRMLVRVVSPNLSLLAGGDASRSFFTIENHSGDDIDLSEWQAMSGEKTFTFPKNTILAARKSATFASEVTSLATPTGSIPEIWSPNGMRVEVKTEAHTSSESSPQIPQNTSVKNVVTARATSPVLQNQEATVANAFNDSLILPQEREESSLWPWYVGASFIAAFALLGLRLVRKNETNSDLCAEDFEIIEDEEPY